MNNKADLYNSYSNINILNDEDRKNIKDVFVNQIINVVMAAREKNEKAEPVLKVVIPEEFIEGIKNGDLKFMESKDGDILPNIINSKGNVVKQIRLKEVEENIKSMNLDKLKEYAVERKLDAMKEQLEQAIYLLENIEKGQRNDRYSKIDSAIVEIRQSFITNDDNYSRMLKMNAQGKLNEALASISKSFNEGISFFMEWEEKTKIERMFEPVKYSTKNIKKVFNELCEDYLHIKRAKNILIELQLSIGVEKQDIELLLDEFYKEDKKIEEANIKSWLPPMNNKNEWQYRILNMPSYNREIVIEYNTTELLKERK